MLVPQYRETIEPFFLSPKKEERVMGKGTGGSVNPYTIILLENVARYTFPLAMVGQENLA
jgi:hypothetical protein